MAVFLRADIFDEVRKHAREPDKITTLQVEWDDQELLARVIEDRYVAQHEGSRPEELWMNYFCESVAGRSTREFLLRRSRPWPRDLVFLCNACVLNAIKLKNHRIEEVGVLTAQEDYSRFAFDALQVEGTTSEELDDVLLQFAGAPHTMPMSGAMSLDARRLNRRKACRLQAHACGGMTRAWSTSCCIAPDCTVAAKIGIPRWPTAQVGQRLLQPLPRTVSHRLAALGLVLSRVRSLLDALTSHSYGACISNDKSEGYCLGHHRNFLRTGAREI